MTQIETATELWRQQFSDLLSKGIPDIYNIWKHANDSLKDGDGDKAMQYENLIFLLHKSFVSRKCELGKGVKFGYGGIGLVVHETAEIGAFCMIGQGITIGGASGGFRIDKNGKRSYVPKLENDVYLAAGSRVMGGITIGEHSVIGANTIVNKNIPPFSVVVGSPGKVLKTITLENCLHYKSYFLRCKKMSNEEYIEYFKKKV